MSTHTDVTILAYLAGIVDGEGYIGIKKTRVYAYQNRKTPGYSARIQVRMVEPDAVSLLASSFGGTLYCEKPHATRGRPLHCWSVSSLQAEDAIRSLYPFLQIKRRQARNALALRRLQRKGKQHRTKIVGSRSFPNARGTNRVIQTKCFSDEYVAWCESLWTKAKSLNAG